MAINKRFEINNYRFEGREPCTTKNIFEGHEPRQTTCTDSISGGGSSSSLHSQTQQQLINHVAQV